MEILNTILILIIFCVIPAGVIWLCRRVKVLGKIGPIMVLYAIGMIIGNLPIMPQQMAVVQEILPNVLIPLAIPMMLYSCSFSNNQAKLQIKLVFSGFFSVALAVIIGFLLFGRDLPEGCQIGGIITGMYTGGTLNAAALQTIFKVKSESFILINSYDIIISFVYFIFLFSFGIKMFRRMYKQNPERHLTSLENEEISKELEQTNVNPYKSLLTKDGAKQLAKSLLVTVLIAAISGGIALLLPDSWFMVIFILLITTLGVACSFIPSVRNLNLSYDIGMYLIFIFSITIASMADFSNLDLAGGINQLLFMVVAVFISLFLHAIFCRMLKVDADSMVISSVAFINSPPFVPMASAAMKNRDALVTGLAAGIIGYATGNHLGVLMEQVLRLFQ